MLTDQNITLEKAKEMTDKLQDYGVKLPGQGKFFGEFLMAHPGLVASMGLLIQKIHNDTAESKDYIEVAKDITDIAVGATGMVNFVAGTRLYMAKEYAFAFLDYADAHDYNVEEMIDDITERFNDIQEMIDDYTTQKAIEFDVRVRASKSNQTLQTEVAMSYIKSLGADDLALDEDGATYYLLNGKVVASAIEREDGSIIIMDRNGSGMEVNIDGSSNGINDEDSDSYPHAETEFDWPYGEDLYEIIYDEDLVNDSTCDYDDEEFMYEEDEFYAELDDDLCFAHYGKLLEASSSVGAFAINDWLIDSTTNVEQLVQAMSSFAPPANTQTMLAANRQETREIVDFALLTASRKLGCGSF